MAAARQRGGRVRDVAVVAAVLSAIAAAVFVVLGVGSGLGFGWTGTLGTANVIRSWMSLATDLGQLSGQIGILAGLGDHTDTVLTITRGLGGLVAALLCLRLLLLVLRGRLDPVTGLGVGLGAVVLLGPVVHPWYLLWAAIPLAATRGMPRHRRAALAASALLAVMLPPTGSDFAFRSFQLPLAILAGIVILAGRAAGRAAGAACGRAAVPGEAVLDDGAVAAAASAKPLDARSREVRRPPPATGPLPRPDSGPSRPDRPRAPIARITRLSVRERSRADPIPVLRKRPCVSVRGLVKRYGSVTAVDGLDLDARPRVGARAARPERRREVDHRRGLHGLRRRGRGRGPGARRGPGRARPTPCAPGSASCPRAAGPIRACGPARCCALVAACAAHPLDPAWLIDVLGLGGCARTPYKRLSGGQQQRLALACAIVGRPELVFLDEPTAGLDPQGRRLVWELVDALRRDGVAVLLTTHLMEEAEALADHVVIVDHGRVVAEGSPAALTTGGDQELRFRARPGMDVAGLATALPAGYRAAETLAGRYVVQGRIDPAVLSAITGWCAAQGALADDVQVARRSLEDVFLELTGRELRS